jgi:hypothetical protein
MPHFAAAKLFVLVNVMVLMKIQLIDIGPFALNLGYEKNVEINENTS